MTDAAEVVHERRGAVLVLRLNRPEARNALTFGMIADITGAIADAESDPEIRAVVLTGTGDRAFCAGMDLRTFADGDGATNAQGDEGADGYVRLLAGDVSLPIVGAANGSAVAGGLELLFSCDVVIASSEAQFGLPEVKRGLFAGSGVMHIGRRIPLVVALELALTGDTIDASRAYELGLVNAVVAPDDVLDTALAVAERIAANGPLGVAATKELVRKAAAGAPDAAERLHELIPAVFGSEDAKEGSRAFMEKRPPSGRGGDVRAALPVLRPAEVVQIEEIPSPPLEPGQVRVRVSAAAVNFPDVLIVANEYQITVPTPFVPGSEFAGVSSTRSARA